MAVDPISTAGAAGPIAPLTVEAPSAPGGGFGEALQRLLGSVESSAGAANTAVGDMIAGRGDVHDAMIALQRAEMTLELTVQVRNKLVQAYQDVMRMPI